MHPAHQQMYVVERPDQIHDGATLHVHVPKKRIFISVPPNIKHKAVVWYAGATASQIERSIAKAAGFEPAAPVELRDGEDVVVLSTSLPNDIHLEVSQAKRSLRSATPSTASIGVSARGKLLSSASCASAGPVSSKLRKERQSEKSPPRQRSPRSRSGTLPSVGGSTTPTAHQSAPE
ncbi:unnamed protein product, partial [Effrenium voratum]